MGPRGAATRRPGPTRFGPVSARSAGLTLRPGRRPEPGRRPGRPLPRRHQPHHRRADDGLLGRLAATPTSARRAASGARRSSPAPRWSRPTCPTWPRSCRSSTSSRSSASAGDTRRPRCRGAGSSSRASTSTSASSRPCPRDHDPVALRELFSPAFIDWITRLPAEVDFGITDSQLFFHWRLRELTQAELEAALEGAAGVFKGLQREMAENGLTTYNPGPWNAGLEPFPEGA